VVDATPIQCSSTCHRYAGGAEQVLQAGTDVETFQQGRLRDDIAILVIEATP
jgi:hypothetical protein